MLSASEQERLTRVGPGTPMGELLRRYWHPILPSALLSPEEVRPVRILGEHLVAFRDATGRVGLLAEGCPHRGTSLSHGCVDDLGLRCPYHGWRFDPAGICTAMPAEPENSPLKQRVRARSFPTQELGGLIFAYLGPAPAPLLPPYDLFVWDGVLRDIGYATIPCNWLQIMENSVDPVHVEWLHGHHLTRIRQKMGLRPPAFYARKQIRIGFDIFEHGIIKRRVMEGGSEDDDDWRVGHPLIFPNILRVGAHGQFRFQIRVPVDDTHTLHFWYACYRPPAGRTAPPQDTVPCYDVPWQDERGSFRLDFVDGQDIMAWVTQGPIADRTRENLGTSDQGILLYRRLLAEQLSRIAAGQDPMGVLRAPGNPEIIELPQERNKFGDGAAFMAEALQLSHVRYSPLRAVLTELFAGVAAP